jgi:hypothetical protein
MQIRRLLSNVVSLPMPQRNAPSFTAVNRLLSCGMPTLLVAHPFPTGRCKPMLDAMLGEPIDEFVGNRPERPV